MIETRQILGLEPRDQVAMHIEGQYNKKRINMKMEFSELPAERPPAWPPRRQAQTNNKIFQNSKPSHF